VLVCIINSLFRQADPPRKCIKTSTHAETYQHFWVEMWWLGTWCLEIWRRSNTCKNGNHVNGSQIWHHTNLVLFGITKNKVSGPFSGTTPKTSPKNAAKEKNCWFSCNSDARCLIEKTHTKPLKTRSHCPWDSMLNKQGGQWRKRILPDSWIVYSTDSGHRNRFFDPASEFLSTHGWSQNPACQSCFYKPFKNCHPV